ncbi:hypothetical protein D3C78_1235200 [compost metagenome]
MEIDHLEIVGGRLGQRFARLFEKTAFLAVIITRIAAVDGELRLERNADILAHADKGGEVYLPACCRVGGFQLKRKADGVVIADIGDVAVFDQLRNRIGHGGKCHAACRIGRYLRRYACFARFAPIGDPAVLRLDLQHAAHHAVRVHGKACHAHQAALASGPVGNFGLGGLHAAEEGGKCGRETKM